MYHRDLIKLPIMRLFSIASREVSLAKHELSTRSRQYESWSNRYFRSLITAISIIVTRWLIRCFQLAVILMMIGIENLSWLIKTDILIMTYKLYNYYQVVYISYLETGFSNKTELLLWQSFPWICCGTIIVISICVVRGIKSMEKSETRHTIDPLLLNDMGCDNLTSPPFVSTDTDGRSLSDGIQSTRTTVEEPIMVSSGRIACSTQNVPSGCLMHCIFIQLGFFWCLHPVSSLRGAYLEVKRHIGTNFSNGTVNGIPMTVMRITLLIFCIVSDYIYARTLAESDEEGDYAGSPLYRFYNYIHGLTGLERRQSQIPSDFESVSSYPYGTINDEHDCDLDSVVVVP